MVAIIKERRESLNDIIKPLYCLYPFSMSIASTASLSPRASVLYRTYVLITLIVSTAGIWSLIYLISYKVVPAVFNIIGVLFASWLFHLLLTTWLLYRYKKNKIKKLIQEIEGLDRKLDAIDSRCKKLRWRSKLWVSGLAVYHAAIFTAYMCTAIKEITWVGDVCMVLILAFIKLVQDSEVVCFSCFASILSSRVECFAIYLNDLVEKNNKTCKQQLDILSCYRNLLHVMKRVNSIWQTEMFMIIVFECYFAVRNILSLFNIESYKFVNITKGIETCQHLALAVGQVLVCGVLGAAGHQLSSLFDRVHVLAVTISVSDLPDWARVAGWCMRRVGLAQRGRLRALDLLTLDATLSLRICSALLTTVVLALQFKVEI